MDEENGAIIQTRFREFLTASSLSPCYRSGGVNGSNIDGSPSYALLEAESPAHNASLVGDGEEVSKS